MGVELLSRGSSFWLLGWRDLRSMDARLKRPCGLQQFVRIKILHKVLLARPLHFLVQLVEVLADGLLSRDKLPLCALANYCGCRIHLVIVVD